MSLTAKIDGDGVRVIDTAASYPIWGPSLLSSLTITEFVQHKLVCGTGGATSVPFGGVAAAKVFVLKTSEYITLGLTVNSESLSIAMTGVFLLQNSSGEITAATVTNNTGSDVTVDVFIAG